MEGKEDNHFLVHRGREKILKVNLLVYPYNFKF